jgi:hypothetical protein
MNGHAFCMCRQRPKVLQITTEDRPAWLGTGNDDGVDCGASACERSERPGPASQSLRKFLDDVAGLEEAVDSHVGPVPSGQRLDENDRRHDRWP